MKPIQILHAQNLSGFTMTPKRTKINERRFQILSLWIHHAKGGTFFYENRYQNHWDFFIYSSIESKSSGLSMNTLNPLNHTDCQGGKLWIVDCENMYMYVKCICYHTNSYSNTFDRFLFSAFYVCSLIRTTCQCVFSFQCSYWWRSIINMFSLNKSSVWHIRAIESKTKDKELYCYALCLIIIIHLWM